MNDTRIRQSLEDLEHQHHDIDVSALVEGGLHRGVRARRRRTMVRSAGAGVATVAVVAAGWGLASHPFGQTPTPVTPATSSVSPTPGPTPSVSRSAPSTARTPTQQREALVQDTRAAVEALLPAGTTVVAASTSPTRDAAQAPSVGLTIQNATGRGLLTVNWFRASMSSPPDCTTLKAGTKSDVRACDERTVPAGQVVTFDRVEVPGGPADARLWASTQSRSDDAQVEISVVNRIPTEKAGTITTMPLTLAELTTMTSSTRWDALATRYLTLWPTG